MKYFGKKKKETGSTVQDAVKESKFGDFRNAVEQLHKAGGGKVTVMKRLKESDTASKVGPDLDIADVLSDEDFYQTIETRYKAGIYTLKLWDTEAHEKSVHHFQLGDPGEIARQIAAKKGKKKKKKKKSSGKSGNEIRIKDLVSFAEAMKSQNNGLTAKDMMDFGIQIATLMKPDGDGGSDIIEAFMSGFQIRGEVQPQVQQEEGWTAIMSAVSPLLTALLTAKQGGNMAEASRIEAEIQRRLAGATAVPGPASQHPPAPGASASAQAAGLLGGQGQAASEPRHSAGSQEYFMERYVQPFQRDVAGGETDEELAYQIVAMVQYARDRMADNPPQIVAKFLEAQTMAEHDAALAGFFAVIPELSGLTQKQASIKNVLIMMFVRGEIPQEEAAVLHQEETASDSANEIVIDQGTINQDQIVQEDEIHDANRDVIRESEDSEGAEVQD